MNWLPTGDQVLLKLQEKTDKTQNCVFFHFEFFKAIHSH